MGLFSWFQPPKRRTSRRNSSRPKGPPKRTSQSTRRGYLKIGSVTARTAKSRKPMFKGRIQVDRGSGFAEFPTYDQFKRIAREEHIPAGDVEIAFGHLGPKPKRSSRPKARRSSRRRSSRRSSQRRSSRRPSSRRRVNRNVSKPGRLIEKGKVYTESALDGSRVPLGATEVPAPAQLQGSGQTAIMVEGAGDIRIVSPRNVLRVLEPWFTEEELQRAFGHLLVSFDGKYGKRGMKLGHREAPNLGRPKAGVVRGQLILFHKTTGQVVWEAWDDSENFPHIPLWIWYQGRTGHFDFEDAVRGAVVGRGPAAVPGSAMDVDIPPMAMLTAFGHMLSPGDRRLAYEALARL